MHNRRKQAVLVITLSACLASSPGTAAPPNKGASAGSGGFHGGGGGGGNVSTVNKSVGTSLNTSGNSSGGNNAIHNFKATTGVSSGITSGAGGSSSQSQSLLKKNNVTTFNQNLTNHTPTFTNPAHVTIPTNKLSVSTPNVNKLPNVNNLQVNSHITTFNSQLKNPVGGNQFQTFHKTVGGPFQAHAISGNQLFLHTNQGQVQSLNAHVYNKAFLGNQAIHLAPIGYQPSYLMHANCYNGPWSGSAWGWGWGLGPGFGFGFGGLGWGIGIGSGWGYGGLGYNPYWPYGPYGYWGRPLGWGFGGWGLGTLAYNSGYNPYFNPYYFPPINQTVVYNYSNPIPVATNVAGAGPVVVDNSGDPPPIPQVENADFDAARAAFRDGNYAAALAAVDAAIATTPTDSVLHEFRGLTLFAMRDFKQAAGVIHSLLAVGPGWDWTTMSGLYADPDTYTGQLRTLEQYVLANPKAADAHFLLAYHYTTTGHSAAAANQLQQTVKLMPSDRLAGELLKMVQGPPKQDPATPPAPGVGAEASATASADGPQPDPINKDLLPGAWYAARADGSKFNLQLTDDGNFTWKFSAPKQKGDEFAGTWSVEGPVLILQREGGGALPGTVTFDGNGKFNFRMVGAPPEDKGLDFNQ